MKEIHRVLYFLDFPNAFGGAANTLIRQAAAMKNFVPDILITIPLDDKGFAIDEFEQRCRHFGLSYDFQKYSVSITSETVDVIGLMEDYTNIEKYIKNYNPDIVHSTQINTCVEMVCRRLKIPHIMNIYPCTEHIFKMEYMDIFPHYHICDSKYYQVRWKKRLQLDSICIRNICEEIRIVKQNSKIPKLICVGRVYEVKNQLEIIKAVHRLITEDIKIRMLLIGTTDTPYGQKCIDYVKKNHIDNWIEIRGVIPFAEMEIAKSDALICGSITESFPNVIGEAMAAKTVVISTPVGGVPEILKDDENAYICNGYKENDIYMSIRKYLNQRGTQKQKNLIENAFQTYKAEFSREAVEMKLYSYYKHVCEDTEIKNITDIQLKELLVPYIPLVKRFVAHKNSFQKACKMQNMIWLVPYIKKSIKNNPDKKLIIWGAGIYGTEAITFAKLYFPELKINGFLDREKQGEYLGYSVKKIEEIEWKNCLVWIAFLYGQMDAVKILLEMGLKYHKDFFFLAPVNL